MLRRTKTVVGAGLVLFLTAGASSVARAEGEETSDPAPPSSVVDAAPSTTLEVVVPISDPEPEAQAQGEGDDDTSPPATEAPAAEADPTTSALAAESEAPASTGAAAATSSVPDSQHTGDQETVVTGTQVAASNTGGNAIVSEQPPSGVAEQDAQVDTGDADAIGSRDQNTIVQQADVVLTDEAVANLLQIALILNIGAAVANSGANSVGAFPGGDGQAGVIGTGDATAVGNDIAAYITQAANVEATSAVNDDASQLAISLFLGLAIANSGVNSVSGTGVAGSGGAVGTGDVVAIGNDSITDVTQRAALWGTDAAQLNVLQRATVLNLGFALANSGLNDISGVAGDLLAAGDDEDDALAQQLFIMLLPALLESYGYGTGSGSIASGDASATGNRSETYVQQTVGAIASGDGVVNVSQDVLVANVGGAAANTGANTLGSVRTLDAQTASAVVQMAAFLANLLAIVHSSSSAAVELSASSQSLAIPFGDLVLMVEGRIGGLDTELRQGNAQANIRQISIVLSLGLAYANTGLNATAVVSDSSMLAAVNTPDARLLAVVGSVLPEMVTTGDAAASNEALVVICQRIDAEDVDCLAPPDPEEPPVDPETPVDPSTPEDPSTPVDPGTPGSPVVQTPVGFAPSVDQPTLDTLPATGSGTFDLVWMGATLVFVGLALTRVRRRPATVASGLHG